MFKKIYIHKRGTQKKKKKKIISGLRLRRVGFCYSLGRSFERCGLSYPLALRILLASKGECGKYKYLALGHSLFLGGVLGRRWELSWLKSFLFS